MLIVSNKLDKLLNNEEVSKLKEEIKKYYLEED